MLPKLCASCQNIYTVACDDCNHDNEYKNHEGWFEECKHCDVEDCENDCPLA